MAVYKCKMCGGDLEIGEGNVAVCEYCGTKQTVPTLDNERKESLFGRAGRLLRACEFDKASVVFGDIVSEFPDEAEAYWGLLLCKYGVEYVDDPATGKKIPTCHRLSFNSVMEDADFEQALENADYAARGVYREEAKFLEELRRNVIEVSAKEEPYDVFICYKETDANGDRTIDSVMAQDIYNELTEKGLKVFFARITLEDKLGMEYEPYIFAALNSAKVMLAIGTDYEYFNAVWVKNEWSRFLKLMANGEKKVLIPCYKGIDAYDMPKEFRNLQAQDMGKLGFMQDLIRGVCKIVGEKKTVIKETVITAEKTNISPLLKRAFMFLEDGDFASADEYCEKVLDNDPECAEAYLGKLMVELKVQKREQLAAVFEPFTNSGNYKKAVRFADSRLSAELGYYLEEIKKRKENERFEKIYVQSKAAMNSAKTEKDFISAAGLFDEIAGYKDSATLAEDCRRGAKDAKYAEAEALLGRGDSKSVRKAKAIYESLSGWRDSEKKLALCDEKALEATHREEKAKIEKERRGGKVKFIIPAVAVVLAAAIIGVFVLSPLMAYNNAVKLMESGDYEAAGAAFAEMADYKDSSALITECDYQLALDLMESGEYDKAIEAFKNLDGYGDSLKNIAGCEEAITEINYQNAVSLLDGENFEEAKAAFASLSGYKDSDEKISECEKGMKYLSAVELLEAKNYMGAVKIFAEMKDFKDSGEYFTKIIKILNPQKTIATSWSHTVGLKNNGTVVATGSNDYGQCNVSDWKNIVAVSVGAALTVGLKSDGTVVATGANNCGQCNVSDWKNIVAVSASNVLTVGLKSDGTVVAVGWNESGLCNVSDWKDIVKIFTYSDRTIGLKADGTVVAIGRNDYGQCNVSKWENIVSISCDAWHTVGLKSDGTVVATGKNNYGQCNVSGWKDIVSIICCTWYTVGLKSDGTVVAVGDNYDGQCNVSGWKDIVAISAGVFNTIGLKSDGTVVATVATRGNDYGQSNVSGWTDIRVPEVDW